MHLRLMMQVAIDRSYIISNITKVSKMYIFTSSQALRITSCLFVIFLDYSYVIICHESLHCGNKWSFDILIVLCFVEINILKYPYFIL